MKLKIFCLISFVFLTYSSLAFADRNGKNPDDYPYYAYDGFCKLKDYSNLPYKKRIFNMRQEDGEFEFNNYFSVVLRDADVENGKFVFEQIRVEDCEYLIMVIPKQSLNKLVTIYVDDLFLGVHSQIIMVPETDEGVSIKSVFRDNRYNFTKVYLKAQPSPATPPARGGQPEYGLEGNPGAPGKPGANGASVPSVTLTGKTSGWGDYSGITFLAQSGSDGGKGGRGSIGGGSGGPNEVASGRGGTGGMGGAGGNGGNIGVIFIKMEKTDRDADYSGTSFAYTIVTAPGMGGEGGDGGDPGETQPRRKKHSSWLRGYHEQGPPGIPGKSGKDGCKGKWCSEEKIFSFSN